MKKFLYIILSLVLILAAFFFYESRSFNNYLNHPNQGAMNIPINENSPVKSKNQIEINAPVDNVWNILTEISKWTDWQKDVTESVVHGEIQEGTEFDWKAGGLSFKSMIHTFHPKTMFGWTGKTTGASAIHNWYFEESNNKTIVKVEESLQGVFPRLFRGYFQKNLDAGVLKNLSELKAAAEKN